MQHTTEKDLWLVINGNVCNMSDFLSSHPGGADPILQMGGKDTTNMFQAIDAHSRSDRANNEMKKRIIGRLDPTSKRPEPPRAQANRRNERPIRYGVDPRLFWLGVVAVVAFLVWLALR